MRTVTGLEGILLVARREVRERGRSKSFMISSWHHVASGGSWSDSPGNHRGRGRDSPHRNRRGRQCPHRPGGPATSPSRMPRTEKNPERFETVELRHPGGSGSGARGRGGRPGPGRRGQRSCRNEPDSRATAWWTRSSAQPGSVRLQRLVQENGQAAADVIAILSSTPLEVTGLDGADPEADIRPVIAYAGLLLMYIAILSYGSWTLTGVTEEKNNRVVEVLLATLRPWQLLGGKVLGIGILGIGQFVLTIGFAFVLVNLTEVVDIPPLPIDDLLFVILWFILGFSVYSVSYAAAGSLASRPEDAQAAAFPMTMLAVAGFFVSINALDDPTSMLARVTSFIPFTAPFVVPIRRSLDGIGTAEHVASALVAIVSIVVLVRLSARIYTGGLLRFGRRVKLREAWRAARL